MSTTLEQLKKIKTREDVLKYAGDAKLTDEEIDGILSRVQSMVGTKELSAAELDDVVGGKVTLPGNYCSSYSPRPRNDRFATPEGLDMFARVLFNILTLGGSENAGPNDPDVETCNTCVYCKYNGAYKCTR